MKLSLSWSSRDLHLPSARQWAESSKTFLRKARAFRPGPAARKLSSMLESLDAPRVGCTAETWAPCQPQPPTWLVQCVLSRRQGFGTVTIVTTSCHTASDADEAKLLGMQAAASDRSAYRLDLVTATPFKSP